MAVTKVLIEIAKRSPKHYAEQIKQRNEKLLKHLEFLYKKHKKNSNEEWGKITVYKGCPHCNPNYQCHSCFWREVRKVSMNSKHFACCTAKFNGVTLLDTCNFLKGKARYGFTLQYGWSDAAVKVTSCTSAQYEKSYQRCKKFLEGHIEWAELDCWGEKCKEK